MLEITDAQLSAYLEEALPDDQLVAIETQLRNDESLRKRLQMIIGREDAGLHSIGVIWRRNRLSCPSRDELSRFLLDVLEPEFADYVRFHIQSVACAYCSANLEDLRQSQTASQQTSSNDQQAAARRQRYFETSVGRLKKKP